MSDDSKNLSRVEDLLKNDPYLPKTPMSRVEKLLEDGILPKVTPADNGKILKVKDGEWETGEDISGDKLPPVSSADNGKVLKVVDAEWNIGEDEGDRLPFVTGADEGKVLKVNDQGHWEAEEEDPELPATTSADEGKILKVDSNGDWSTGDETTELPSVSSSDNGKVLKVTEGQWGKGDLPSVNEVPAPAAEDSGKVLKAIGANAYGWWPDEGLPAVTSSDNGKVLKVDNGSWGVGNETMELPSVSSSDNGKILKVADGNWTKGDAPTELPAVSGSDNGKILKVTEGQWAKGDAPSSLPAVTSSDEGKVLAVNSSGEWDKANAPSGLPDVDSSDNNKALLVQNGAWTKANLPEVEDLYVPVTQAQYDALPSSKLSDDVLYFITDGQIEGLIPTVLTEVQYDLLTPEQKADPTKIYLVGGSYICYKGVTYYEPPYVALTQSQYDALPESKLTDGKMYYITDQDGNELPEVTASDNGKVLKVVNGAWDKGDAPTELPAVTSSDNGKVLKVINGDWTKSNDVLIVNAVDKSGAAANTLVLEYTYAELLSLIGYGANIMIKYHVPNTNSDEYYHLKRNNISSTPDWASLIFQVPFVSESNSDEYGNNIIDLSTPEIVIRPLGSTDNPDGYTAKRWPHGDWSNTCARVPLPRTNNQDVNRVLSINSSSEIDWDYPINLSLHDTVVGIDYNSHNLKQRVYRNTTQIISAGQHSYTINLGLISGQQQLSVLRLVACCGTITTEETGGDYYLLDLLHDSKFGVRLYSIDLTNAVIEIDVPTGYKLDGGFTAVFQYGCN